MADHLRGLSPRQRLWMLTVPPVERRAKLWIVRGRLHQGTGYYSPFERIGLPRERKPTLRRVIHTAESREAARDF